MDDNRPEMHTPLIPPLPPPPALSAGPGLSRAAYPPTDGATAVGGERDIDVFTMSPQSAMKILCNVLESLIRDTEDAPSTLANIIPQTSLPQGLEPERQGNPCHTTGDGRPPSGQATKIATDIDGVPEKAETLTGSSEADALEPGTIVDAKMEPLSQRGAKYINRFNVKQIPTKSIEEYLLHIHHVCPMTTGVYLATSLYIHRAAETQKIILVTIWNVHRLLLGGLRVATKYLEDNPYKIASFALAGGVSEALLTKLELCFCYLADWELTVNKEMLLSHAAAVEQGVLPHALPVSSQPHLPTLNGTRNVDEHLAESFTEIVQLGPGLGKA